jgi:c-di-GMP-related signal transduction protein
LVGPLITSKTDYVAIASRRGERRRNQLMSKTGYVKIASRLVTVALSCFRATLLTYSTSQVLVEKVKKSNNCKFASSFPMSYKLFEIFTHRAGFRHVQEALTKRGAPQM